MLPLRKAPLVRTDTPTATETPTRIAQAVNESDWIGAHADAEREFGQLAEGVFLRCWILDEHEHAVESLTLVQR